MAIVERLTASVTAGTPATGTITLSDAVPEGAVVVLHAGSRAAAFRFTASPSSPPAAGSRLTFVEPGAPGDEIRVINSRLQREVFAIMGAELPSPEINLVLPGSTPAETAANFKVALEAVLPFVRVTLTGGQVDLVDGRVDLLDAPSGEIFTLVHEVALSGTAATDAEALAAAITAASDTPMTATAADAVVTLTHSLVGPRGTVTLLNAAGKIVATEVANATSPTAVWKFQAGGAANLMIQVLADNSIQFPTAGGGTSRSRSDAVVALYRALKKAVNGSTSV